jgi:hypothetical protein
MSVPRSRQTGKTRVNNGSSLIGTVFVVLLAICLFAVLFGAFLLVPLLVVIFGVVALFIAQRTASNNSSRTFEPPEKKDSDPPDPHA